MTWGYRIVRYFDRQKGFGIHEVFYDDQGNPTAMTAEPCVFGCDEDEEPQVLTLALRRAARDAEMLPVFEEPEAWLGPLRGSSQRSSGEVVELEVEPPQ